MVYRCPRHDRSKPAEQSKRIPRYAGMRTIAIALTTILGYLTVPLPALADIANGAAATLTVTGEGRVMQAPDVATVSVTIVTNDDNAARALLENNRRYATLIAKLAANAIPSTDVRSTSIQSYLNPRPSDRGAAGAGQLYGFVVTRNAQISLDVLTQTGVAVDAANAAGANQINGVTYGFRDRRALERAALSAAVVDADAQAQTIARAAHVHIVRILQIGNGASPPPTPEPVAMLARSVEAPQPTTIAPSDIEVSGFVTITYIIQ